MQFQTKDHKKRDVVKCHIQDTIKKFKINCDIFYIENITQNQCYTISSLTQINFIYKQMSNFIYEHI